MPFDKRLKVEMEPQWSGMYIHFARLKRLIRADPFDEDAFLTCFEENLTTILGHCETTALDLHRMYDELKSAIRDSTRSPLLCASDTRNPRHVPLLSIDTAGSPMSTSTEVEFPVPEVNLSERNPKSERTPTLRYIDIPRSTILRFRDSWWATLMRFKPVHDSISPDHSMRRAYRQVYRLAVKLFQFAELNIEGLEKIQASLKKYHGENCNAQLRIRRIYDRNKLWNYRTDANHLAKLMRVEYSSIFKTDVGTFTETSSGQLKWELRVDFLLLALGVLFTLWFTPIFQSNGFAHRCAALMGFIVSLWVTEAMPYFCTAMLIPFLAVVMRVLPDPSTGLALKADECSTLLLGSMFNHVQILVLGGLTMSKAITKHGLEYSIALWIHRISGHRPNIYLLNVMVAGVFFSAVVSNVAAPVLLLGVLQETIWALPTNSGAQEALLLGLAFACNLGGMLNPIASPQNAVAQSVLGDHEISFLLWITLSAPVVVIGVLFCWVLLIMWWKPFASIEYVPAPSGPDGEYMRNHRASIWEKRIVIVVCGITLLLWVLQPIDAPIFGNPAIIALIPIVIFFGTGVLTKVDFNSLSWHLLFLLAGGNMIGLCTRQSSLLSNIADSFQVLLDARSVVTIFLITMGFIVLITSFISHTVAAIILLPLVRQIALREKGSQEVFVFCAVLICSGAMALPITSFPNVNSLLAEDESGKPYLVSRNYIIPGAIMTLVTFALCILLYPIAKALIS
ncbi:sodium/sulfate symporter [Perkinsela sp. CCAP 1560/4]|nr:sodium/sulfate symporter [Perkinsela sp. CCAP 1560/4]|eukprot:KNH08888.1 sodium/sulfate symporter [Perkinsela sp. CCAP 1560/4]